MPQLSRVYARYNRLYFDNLLPHNTITRWARLRDDLANLTPSDPPVIQVHTSLRGWEKIWRLSILHEMAHLASGDMGHGDAWQREMLRLARAGAFTRLW